MESTEYQLVSTDVNWVEINKVTRLFFAEKFPCYIMFQIKKEIAWSKQSESSVKK